MELTLKKIAILNYIELYQAESGGVSPTLREIALHMGITSLSTIHVHLKDLKRMGYLDRGWNAKRAIKIIGSRKTRQEAIPLMGYIAAGKPIESIADPKSHLLSGFLSVDGSTYMLKVTGDSMVEDGIRDGDFVLIKDVEMAPDGSTVVALVRGEVTLKRIFREGRFVTLKPSNPRHKSITLPGEEVSVQGVVIALLRRY